jgi:hypothetical protein
MKTIRYLFHIDEDVQKKYNTKDVEFLILAYLNDPDGWGYKFLPVSSNEDVHIRLSSSKTIKSICGLPQNLSCAELGGKHMYLNAERWFHGSSKSKLKLEDYRQYMVSHEMGHILGYDHKKCPCKGCLAPIMMQQTLGIGQCHPNTKVNK